MGPALSPTNIEKKEWVTSFASQAQDTGPSTYSHRGFAMSLTGFCRIPWPALLASSALQVIQHSGQAYS